MKPMEVTDEMLMAYVDGELDAQTRGDVQAAIGADPSLARRVNEFEASAAAVRESFAGLLGAEPPAALLSAVRDTPEGNLVSFPRRIFQNAAMPLAAGIALAIGLGGGYWLAGPAGPNQASSGGLFAGGDAVAVALADYADGQPIALDVDGVATQLSVLGSYPIDGGTCRSFSMALETQSINGVGCDRGDGYTIEMAVSGPPDRDGFALASDRVTQSLDAYLDAIGAGSPLGPQQEAERLDLD